MNKMKNHMVAKSDENMGSELGELVEPPSDLSVLVRYSSRDMKAASEWLTANSDSVLVLVYEPVSKLYKWQATFTDPTIATLFRIKFG